MLNYYDESGDENIQDEITINESTSSQGGVSDIDALLDILENTNKQEESGIVGHHTTSMPTLPLNEDVVEEDDEIPILASTIDVTPRGESNHEPLPALPYENQNQMFFTPQQPKQPASKTTSVHPISSPSSESEWRTKYNILAAELAAERSRFQEESASKEEFYESEIQNYQLIIGDLEKQIIDLKQTNSQLTSDLKIANLKKNIAMPDGKPIKDENNQHFFNRSIPAEPSSQASQQISQQLQREKQSLHSMIKNLEAELRKTTQLSLNENDRLNRETELISKIEFANAQSNQFTLRTIEEKTKLLNAEIREFHANRHQFEQECERRNLILDRKENDLEVSRENLENYKIQLENTRVNLTNRLRDASTILQSHRKQFGAESEVCEEKSRQVRDELVLLREAKEEIDEKKREVNIEFENVRSFAAQVKSKSDSVAEMYRAATKTREQVYKILNRIKAKQSNLKNEERKLKSQREWIEKAKLDIMEKENGILNEVKMSQRNLLDKVDIDESFVNYSPLKKRIDHANESFSHYSDRLDDALEKSSGLLTG